MFDIALKLGTVYDEPRKPLAEKYLKQVRRILRTQDLSPQDCLLRGGFHAEEDLERLIRTGSDYSGRAWPPDNGHAPRLQEGSTFASTLFSIGSTNKLIDPLWHAIQGEKVHAIAFYDAPKLELATKKPGASGADLTEYMFIDQANKKDALLGVVRLEFALVDHAD